MIIKMANQRMHVRMGEVLYKLLPNQVSVDNLRRLFKLEGNVLWLRAELEDIIIFPKEDGRFDLKNDARYGALIVEGPFSEMESSSSRDDVTTSRDSSNWAHGASKRRRVSDPHRQTIIDELENLRSASQDITLKVSSLITLLHGDTAYPQDQAHSL